MTRNLFPFIFLLLSASTAQATQLITCKFAESKNVDQVVIALSSDQKGTLAYKTVQKEVSSESADGVLNLKRGPDPVVGTAGFLTDVQVMQMSFKMPIAQLLKSGVNFKAVLSTTIQELNSSQDQDLNCDAI